MRYIYIDDLLTLNNSRFECAIDDIHVYPPELQLKKPTECPTSLSYLITIDNGKYSTAVYDKRDSMAFKKFARRHAGIFSKYNCSVRKHIEEGICLPAIDGFLCRNVTTR